MAAFYLRQNLRAGQRIYCSSRVQRLGELLLWPKRVEHNLRIAYNGTSS